MDEQQVLTSSGECKPCVRCANQASNSESRRECDQADLDFLLEAIGRIKLIGKMLLEVEDLDKDERGTVSGMLGREADHISEILFSLETRLGV